MSVWLHRSRVQSCTAIELPHSIPGQGTGKFLLSMCTSICCSRQPLQYSWKQPAMACIDSTATLFIQMSQMKPPPPSGLYPSCMFLNTCKTAHLNMRLYTQKKKDWTVLSMQSCQYVRNEKHEQQLQFGHLWLHLCCDLHCLCCSFDSWQSCCRTDQCAGQTHRQK